MILTTFCFSQEKQDSVKIIPSGIITLINKEIVHFSNLYYEEDKVRYFNIETQKQEHLFLPSIVSIQKRENGNTIPLNSEEPYNPKLNKPKLEPIKNHPKLTFISSTKVQLGDSILTVQETKQHLENFPKPYELYKKGRTNRTLGTIFMAVGSGIIVGNAIRNMHISNQTYTNEEIYYGRVKEGNSIPYFIGAGFIGASIPILSSGKKRIKESIDLYNSEYTTQSEVSLNLIGNQLGIGLALSFLPDLYTFFSSFSIGDQSIIVLIELKNLALDVRLSTS